MIFRNLIVDEIDPQSGPDRSIEWGGVEFPEHFDSPERDFGVHLNLVGAVFHGNASFAKCRFVGGLSGRRLRVAGTASFEGCEFFKTTSFTNATFESVTNFNSCQFAADALFGGTTFKGESTWRSARFVRGAQFIDATFHDTTDFSVVRFGNSLETNGSLFPGETSEAVVYFRHVTMEEPRLVHFDGVDLSRVVFTGTDLSQVRFTGCTWARASRWPAVLTHALWAGTRVALLDELATQDSSISLRYRQPTVAQICDQYAQLRLSYEASKQEIEAGEFYIGQMEMRRRGKDQKWPYRLFGLGGYNLLALYGESWFRPALSYLFAALFFGLAYLLAGFSGTSGSTIHYGWGLGGLGSADAWQDFLEAYAHALTAGGLFQQNLTFESWWAPGVRFLNAAWDLLMLSLIAIGLRRRFHK